MPSCYKKLFILIGSLFFLTTTTLFASTGVIDTSVTNKAKVCYDVTCTSPAPGSINFELQQEPSITIDSVTGISGRVWGNTLGWITFNPESAGVTFANATTGLLTGKAWSQVSGWINFAPTGQSVIINPSTGEFSGWAWTGGPYGGWIKFDCNDVNACVKTTWRSVPVVPPTTGSVGPSFIAPIISAIKEILPIKLPPLDTLPSEDSPQEETPVPEQKEEVIKQEKLIVQNTNEELNNPSSSEEMSSSEASSRGESQSSIGSSENTTVAGAFSNSVQDTVARVEQSVQTILLPTIDRLSSLDTTAPALFQSVKTSAVIVGSALAVAPVASSAAGLAPLLDIPRLLAHLWNVLLTALGLRKKRKPWGTVYDSQTKQPLDPAYVTLTNAEGKEVASSLTDIDGRYGFVVPPGTYTLSAKKTNYIFPSKRLSGTFEDELYTSLYFGEQVTITEEGEIINKNIPLDQLAFDWNEFAKNEQHRLTYFKKRDVIIGRISQFFFGAGFLASLIAFVADTSLLQGAIVGVYIAIFFVRRYDPKLKAKGFISKADGSPLPFAIIRLLSIATGQEIAHKVADKVGRYYAIVPNGTYTVTIDEKTPDGSYIKHALTKTVTITKGFLGEEVRVYDSI